jgi:phosphoglycerate dehydrogenase-like enzyme
MTFILVEDDAILKTVPVIIDPDVEPAREQAVLDFYRFDVPDFLGWRAALRGRIPGLFPAKVVFAKDQDDLRAKIPQADGVIVESLTIGEPELALATRLKSVLKFGFLPSNIDVTACAKRNIPVDVQRRRVNVAVAEHALALMLAMAKRLKETEGLVEAEKLREAGWDPTPFDRRYTGNSNFARIPGLRMLNDATLGILGMGEIGREIASRAAAFGMTILYHQRNRIPAAEEWALNATYCPLDELLARSDFFSVNVPMTGTTRGMIGTKELARLKAGAIVVNVARAEIIDRAALIASLDSGRIGGFGLDVGYDEPAKPDEKLLTYKNVLLTPHTAIAGRDNGIADMEEMYGKIWRAITFSRG